MRWTVRVMAALLLAQPATAQSPGTLFVGAFGQWTHFDSKWKLDTELANTFGWGLRVGAFVSPNWSLEADATYTPAASKAGTSFLGSRTNGQGGDVKASTVIARAVYSFPSASMGSLHVGGGPLLENFRGTTDFSAQAYGYGFNALAGMNFVARTFAARVDGFANYIPSNGIRFDVGIQAGIQFSPTILGTDRASASAAAAPVALWDPITLPLPGTVEIGGSLQLSRFDNNGGRMSPAPHNGNIGYAGRVGVFLSDPRWAIEGDGYYSPQSAKVRTGQFSKTARPTEANASALALRLNFNAEVDTSQSVGRPAAFIFGLGVVRTNYKFVGGTGPFNVDNTYNYNLGMSGLVGLRVGIANRLAARIDGVFDWMPHHKPASNINAHLRAGLSVLMGGARPESRCPFPGLENVSAVSPNCVAPTPTPAAPPPPPPPPPASLASVSGDLRLKKPALLLI